MPDPHHAHSDCCPSATQPLAPTRWHRAWFYALAWIPPFAFVAYFIPQFGPIFQVLDEKGDLPPLTHWVWVFVRLNGASFYLPIVLVFTTLIALGEFLIIVSRRFRNHGRYIYGWRAGVIGVGLVAWFVSVKACNLPVFKMDSGASVSEPGRNNGCT
jgi:hypothetical protein